MTRTVVALVSILLVVSGKTADGQWAQWGGPNRDFVVANATPLEGWTDDGPALLWSKELGPGYSAIVSDGERVFTMTRRGSDEVVVALSADTGDVVWEHAYPAFVEATLSLDTTWGSGPNGTPVISGGRVYTAGFTGVLSCLDAATGEVVWRNDLASDFDVATPFFGHSASPILYQNTVVVFAGGAMAFRLEDGALLWENREFEASYASPVLFQTESGVQLVAAVAGEIVALDPEDGRLLWRHPHANFQRVALSGPLVDESDVVFASTYFLGSIGLQLNADGSGVTELWKNPRLQLSHFHGIRIGDIVYGFHNSILLALDVTTGEILWRKRGFNQANMIRVGKQFLLFGQHGRLSLVSIDPSGVTVRAEAQILEGRSWTAPTLIGTRLFARNLERVVAVDLSRSGARAVPATKAERGRIEAPAGFLAAKERLMAAYFRSDLDELAAVGDSFAAYQEDTKLGHLANYYVGFAAYQQAELVGNDQKLGLLREAEDRLKEAIQHDESFAEAHAMLSRIYPMYYQFDPRRAAIVGLLGVDHLATALRFGRDNPQVLAIQGLNRLNTPAQYGGDVDHALEIFGKAIDRFDELPPLDNVAEPDWGRATVWVWYGQALQRQEEADPEGARRAFRNALDLVPDFALARQLLDDTGPDSR